nr:unnamed protein product [Callosobruchus chinensis]
MLTIIASYLRSKTFSVRPALQEAGPSRLSSSSEFRPFSEHQNINKSHLGPKAEAKPSFICNSCGNSGHKRDQCPHSRKMCNFCKTIGHIEAACPLELGLKIIKLDNIVSLSGFTGSSVLVCECVYTEVSIDNCYLSSIQIYVTDKLMDTNLIIGQNFCEDATIS